MNIIIRNTIGALLLLFGGITLLMSSAVLLDLFDIRSKQGNYVPFIVWANWICGFIYLAAAYGFFTKQIWTRNILSSAALILIVGFVSLLFHITSGGLYEQKTVMAMVFRTVMTLGFALLAHYYINKQQ
jgi:hypothetical protein